jgi:ribonuclease HI
LADFIADWTPSPHDKAIPSNKAIWAVFCDGSWGSFGSGAATIIVSWTKVKTSYAAKLQFKCTDNIAEYEALLWGLRKLKAMGVQRATLKSVSQVITGQVDKTSKAKKPSSGKVP